MEEGLKRLDPVDLDPRVMVSPESGFAKVDVLHDMVLVVLPRDLKRGSWRMTA